jgi:hypothetical protein
MESKSRRLRYLIARKMIGASAELKENNALLQQEESKKKFKGSKMRSNRSNRCGGYFHESHKMIN